MATCVVGRVRDCVRCSLTKAMLQLEKLSHCEFCASGREFALSPLWGFLLSPEKPGLFLRFVKE